MQVKTLCKGDFKREMKVISHRSQTLGMVLCTCIHMKLIYLLKATRLISENVKVSKYFLENPEILKHRCIVSPHNSVWLLLQGVRGYYSNDAQGDVCLDGTGTGQARSRRRITI